MKELCRSDADQYRLHQGKSENVLIRIEIVGLKTRHLLKQEHQHR